MLVGSDLRPVAIVGGLRIPFARSYGAYNSLSNSELLTVTLKALVHELMQVAQVLLQRRIVIEGRCNQFNQRFGEIGRDVRIRER